MYIVSLANRTIKGTLNERKAEMMYRKTVLSPYSVISLKVAWQRHIQVIQVSYQNHVPSKVEMELYLLDLGNITIL